MLVNSCVDFMNTIVEYDYDTIVACFCSIFENVFGEDAPFVADDIATVIHTMFNNEKERIEEYGA